MRRSVLAFTFFSSCVYAQTYKDLAEVRLQKKAIEVLVDTLKIKHKKILKKDTLFIATEKIYSSRLPNSMNGINICYLNSDDALKPKKDSIFLLSMSPLNTNSGEGLDINFSLYYVTLTLKTKYWQNSTGQKGEEQYYEEGYRVCGSGGVAHFYFDCKTNNFQLSPFRFDMGYCSDL